MEGHTLLIMLVSTEKNKYKLIKSLGFLLNDEISSEYNFLKPPFIGEIEEGKIIDSLRREIGDEEILDSVSNVSNLVLCLTQKCNLRCKYCVYSGIYKDHRVHSNSTMSIETTQKAIDLFFRHLQLPYRNVYHKNLSIGLYGGESLLELDLIKSIIDYVSKESCRLGLVDKFVITPSISTNGVLLNDYVVDFLVEHNVPVAVSIDGPESVHDQFRVSMDNKGTWRIIMDNLCRFKSRYPEFYAKHVTFLCTVHPLHNGKEVDDFFLSHEEFFDLDGVNKVNFSLIRMEELEDTIKKRIKDSQQDHIPLSRLFYERDLKDKFNSKKFYLNRLTSRTKFTGTCYPVSAKMFISTNGDIHLCEAIPECMPIGNVSAGLDFKRIRLIIQEYNEEIIKNRCWDCDVWFICNVCFLTALREGKFFRINCPEKQIIYNLRAYLQFLEKEHEQTISDFTINTVNDYLNFL